MISILLVSFQKQKFIFSKHTIILNSQILVLKTKELQLNLTIVVLVLFIGKYFQIDNVIVK